MMKKTLFLSVLLSMPTWSWALSSRPDCEIFADGGFFVGCNYWAKNAGMYMWSQWRPDVIERELSELSGNGVSVMRVFPLWSDFQPLTGDCHAGGCYRTFRFRDNRPLPNWAGVDDEMMVRFGWFCDCAERHHIQLIVGIITGWMSGRQFVPEVFEEKNVLADPTAIMWASRFAKYFVSKLKDKKAIVAWDYGNECNCMGATDQAVVYSWMDHIGLAIRSQDATRPIVSGMHGLKTLESSPVPIRLNGEVSDVLCTHPYPFYVPGCGRDAFNMMRDELHPTAESLLYLGLGGKPCFIEEIGNLGTSCTSEDRSAAGMRVVMFSAWANDLKGCLWWCNSDQEGLEFPPYDNTPNERELGLLRQDYTPKPVMLEMKAFQEFRAKLPFRMLPPRKANAVIVVPEKTDGWIPGFGAYLLCCQAGIDPMFAGAEQDLPDAPLYVFCSGESDVSFTYAAQRRLWEKVRNGATALVLYSGDSRLTHIRKYAGIEIDYCTLSPCKRIFSPDSRSGRKVVVDDKTTARLIAREAEVLAWTEEGEPAFTKYHYGKGTTLIANGPFDRQAITRSDVLNGRDPMPYYRIFKEAAAIAALKTAVRKGDCPSVCLTEHPTADGTTIVVAINVEPQDVECPIAVDGKIDQVWRGKVLEDRICLMANEAAVFSVRK